MALTSGTKLGPYEIQSPLGAGGMGEVYRARDTRLERTVAIKVLPAVFAENPERLRRFQQEARVLSGLNHPNLLVIYDVGSQDDLYFLVSELLEGENLRQRLNVGALPRRKAMDYSIQMANGLSAAHGNGIVHRDLKPENLFVTRDGRIKILDFGLAKQVSLEDGALTQTSGGTETGVVLGTVGYMSPEQVCGKPAGPRSDIFAAGAILYEMLTGVRAFQRSSSVETMNAILKEEPPEVSSSPLHAGDPTPYRGCAIQSRLRVGHSDHFASFRKIARLLARRQMGDICDRPRRNLVAQSRRWLRPAATDVSTFDGPLATLITRRQ